ncbi:MAG: pilus assembly protein PilP [Oxalobacteraceae bacterium]|jgi:type IV pilus assembly protein PilP|nr:pilus assembly protein PilP [Oxalobacteraceae sp. CFBP 8763]RYE98712.1 MAG: pilus assembly protein PilP [Oxalobacteraceae bacterium]
MIRAHVIALLAMAALLAGCGDGGVGETRAWMKEVEGRTVSKVKPLPEPKTFQPHAYLPGAALDPFDQTKLLGELARMAQSSPNANQPDLNRPKEPLENFPLDTMRMVGTMKKGGVSYALVQIDRALYRVRPGQRLGQNYGRVTRVSDEAIEIRESVQDATGDWVERLANIELQHNQESSK